MNNKIEQIRRRAINKARGKYLTSNLANSLFHVASKVNSPLRKSYVKTYYCANKLSITDLGNVNTFYCKNRFCMVCLKRRTAQFIDKYEPIISSWSAPHMVTLTIPNVKKRELPTAIKENLLKDFVKIKRAAKREGIDFQCIRNIECTYNAEANNFHPHLHILCNSRRTAQFIKDRFLWLNPNCAEWAQDITRADKNAQKELFKYFTKIFNFSGGKRKRAPIWALDWIFQSVQGLRILQPVGFKVEKDFLEKAFEDQQDLELENAIEESLINPDKAIENHNERAALEDRQQVVERLEWHYAANDWVNLETGELWTGYEPAEEFKRLIKQEKDYISSIDPKAIHEVKNLLKELQAGGNKVENQSSFITSFGLEKVGRIGNTLSALISLKRKITEKTIEKLLDKENLPLHYEIKGRVYYLPKLFADRANGNTISPNAEKGAIFKELFKD